MHINKVKTAIKVGDFILHPNKDSKNHIKVLYNRELKRDVLNNKSGRVYLFTADGIIKKIGGSSSAGGIRSTLSNYATSMTGSPGKPRFIIHLLIRDLLKSKKQVSIYMITSEMVSAKVSGFFDVVDTLVAPFKEMEDRCRKDYFNIEGRHPNWNFKENNEDYPNEYSLEHVKYHENRLKNK